MLAILLIVLLIVLFGGGGGYYWYNNRQAVQPHYGVGGIVVTCLVIWVVGRVLHLW